MLSNSQQVDASLAQTQRKYEAVARDKIVSRSFLCPINGLEKEFHFNNHIF